MNDNDDKGRLNDDINFSAPGGDFQSVLDDDMVPFEQVGASSSSVIIYCFQKKKV